ncbi:MAG: acyltransferase [Proteobacteria bacterium]|nr:acyltransferase [Pseudomonadota bacterium]
MPKRKEKLPEGFSVYLDFVRVMAALMVFIHHMQGPHFLGAIQSALKLGPDAVAIFFVLSGYVIAYVTDHHEKDARTYILHRFARIMPMAVTALLLALVLDPIAKGISHFDYLKENATTVLSSLFFLNHAWWNNIYAMSARPYWSLDYEVWDYALFGVCIFAQGRLRFLLAGAILLLLGPKFLLMLPQWLLGVGVYRLSQRLRPSQAAARLMAVLPVLLYIETKCFRPHLLTQFYMYEPLKEWSLVPFQPSKFWIWHLMLAPMVAVHLFGMRHLDLKILAAAPWAGLIKKAATYTFSLYLFHLTLFRFFREFIPKGGVLYYLLQYVLTLAGIVVLAHYTEHRKVQIREFLRRRFPTVFARR